ncbi:MAG: hypothetical protein M3151_00550 [Actinomycetota bacterium]|nr:hypothetical protein [Actinomycetota bacterium]
MLYHVLDIRLALREMNRVLKPGGRLLATTNSREGLPELLDLHLLTMEALGIPFRSEIDDPFTVENGAEKLGEVFKDVRSWIYESGFEVADPGPMLKYYMATQLYQGPHADPHIPLPKRGAIAETFGRLVAERIFVAGRILAVSKPVVAFVCR